MNRYILSFKTKEDVKAFLKLIDTHHVEFSMKNNIVICSCSAEELRIAQSRFGAEVDTLTSPGFG